MARGIPITRGGVSCSRGIKRLAANVTGSHEMVRRAERVTQPPENSLLLANVSSPFSFGPVCRSSASCPWSSSGGMQMDDFVRESRVSRSCTRPSENNKSRLTTPVRSLRFVSFTFFFFSLHSSFFLFFLRLFAFPNRQPRTILHANRIFGSTAFFSLLTHQLFSPVFSSVDREHSRTGLSLYKSIN